MKKFYRSTLVLCLLLFLFMSCVDFALPISTAVARRLAKNPDKWELQWSDSENTFHGMTPAATKAQLLSFIEHNRNSPVNQEACVAMGILVAGIFCLIGWIRESRLDKRKDRIPGPI